MKILARYILKEHIPPFLFAFLTITFLLVIDFVPRIIEQVIDKNLSIWVVLELIWLNLAWMLALSIPMSVLVATLMAFGRLSSDFEITAIRSSGVNLLHILAPLLVAGGVIMVGMIEFNDKILPDLNKRARVLAGDISAMHPTLVFRSGTFITDIPGYLVLIDKIDHKTSRVDGVRINDTRNPSKPRMIIAEYGFLKMTDGGRNMEFTLHNGELHSLDLENPDNYRKVDFETQVINISGPNSELVRTDSDIRTEREEPIAAMQEKVKGNREAIIPLQQRNKITLKEKINNLFDDSSKTRPMATLSDSVALAEVKTQAALFRTSIQRTNDQIDARVKLVDKFQVEIYKKYSIPAASLVFVLIGAPLGVLARRGGMGTAITISILLFIVYWAFLIGGEDLADRNIVTPFFAMWGANILLGAIGLYLLYVVVSERPVFSFFRRST